MHRIWNGLIATSSVLALLSPAWGQHPAIQSQNAVPRVALPLMKTAPTIDGVIAEDEWASASRNIGFVGHTTGVADARCGVFWVGCDGKQFFLAMKTETPPGGEILGRAVPQDKVDVGAVWKDDSIELVLDPKRGRQTGDRSFYHIITNIRGALYDQSVNPDDQRTPRSTAWRLPGWTLKTSIRDGWWHAEAAIPLGNLGVAEADLKTPWGVRIARNWRRPSQQSQWTQYRSSYLDQSTMPVVRWDATAPVVRILSLQEDWEQARIRVAVRNPHDQALTAKVTIEDAWHHNPYETVEKTVAVAPGAEEVVVMDARDGGPEGTHHTVITVTDAPGEREFYFRALRWNLHRPDALWSIDEEQKQAVGLLFKYYPYHNRIRLRVSVENLDAKDTITTAVGSIAPAEGGQALWQTTLIFAKYASEGVYEIPELPDGEYQLAVKLTGGEGTPIKPATETFVRKHYEWEHNQLGITDEVIPPFTPMTVAGQTVGCVQREMTHGAGGLWQAVDSQGRSLLTAPMRWEVVLGTGEGQPVTVKGTAWKATEHAAHRVVGEAAWSAGALTAHVETEYDYDGMMLVHLRLDPCEAPVQRLSVVLPIVEAEAKYMHACGDGLRYNYAGFVPEGQGQVWDSSKGNKLEITSTFYPYLWVGGGERGVCYFADTDYDWVLDAVTPVVDLSRDGETLTMRLHLMTAGKPLTRAHEITFGLQVTPTKPMPEGWRRWLGRNLVPGGRAVSWMGSNFYWGAMAYDVYPWKKRFDYFGEIEKARETGEMPKAFIKKWMAMIAEDFPPETSKGWRGYEFLKRHVNAGLRNASAAPRDRDIRLFGYTNARGVGFHVSEFATFQDEWLRYAWFGRDWKEDGVVAYDLSASESFRDYAVWYYKKMIDTWADGVYWDNTFLSSHYDPVIGGKVDPEGNLHTGLGLFHLRELIRRTAIMHWQQAKGQPARRLPFVQCSHMTNTMIVPILSFGNNNMDWEWLYGYTDFQDRFSADLTVAETLARQVGAWATILAGGHHELKDPRTERVFRTRAAVCLVHEIRDYDYRPAWQNRLFEKLFAWGYGGEECSVYNYWESPHPVRVTGVDARTLVMRKDGVVIVVVSSYGEDGKAAVQMNLAALGLGNDVKGTNFESGQPVQRTAPGTFLIDLPKHDFRIIEVK